MVSLVLLFILAADGAIFINARNRGHDMRGNEVSDPKRFAENSLPRLLPPFNNTSTRPGR